ncbi:MAG TPA: hypothetical protein VGW33_08000 [Terriglobia bacterium]|nr:hypothetical protein [Terriglobia bacterium]
MLRLPESGIRPYRSGHQTDLSIFCDWLEGSLLFTGFSTLSLSDIKDVLMEEHLYDQQDRASEFLADVWREFDRRLSALGNSYPVQIENLRLRRLTAWRQSPAYSFCLLLSYAERYSQWAKSFGANFTEQGMLFEDITAEALRQELGGWNIHATGWSRARARRLRTIVEDVRARLGEEAGKLEKFPEYRVAKDAGLDVIVSRPFSDNRIGFPLYLVQCASGARWTAKRDQPNLNVWRTLIDFAVIPKKALAIPYALPDRDFWFGCRAMDGMLIDRMRLLSGGRNQPNWVSSGTKRRVIAWMSPRVKALPLYK